MYDEDVEMMSFNVGDNIPYSTMLKELVEAIKSHYELMSCAPISAQGPGMAVQQDLYTLLKREVELQLEVQEDYIADYRANKLKQNKGKLTPIKGGKGTH